MTDSKLHGRDKRTAALVSGLLVAVLLATGLTAIALEAPMSRNSSSCNSLVAGGHGVRGDLRACEQGCAALGSPSLEPWLGSDEEGGLIGGGLCEVAGHAAVDDV
jgi:hypothetical protein